MELISKKKSKLKSHILFRIFIIFILSMLISSIIGFIYFHRIVRTEKINSEIFNQIQIINQLVFRTEDIQNFAKSVVVDDILQDSIKYDRFESEFDRTKNSYDVLKRLAFYNSLRTYIAGSFLELEDGKRYSSSLNNNEALDGKFNTEQVKKYIQNTDLIYSDPYFSLADWINSPIIAYRVDMLSLNDFGEKQGVLYFEIYLDYFIDQIKTYSENYDDVILLGNNNKVLYKKDSENIILQYIDEDSFINNESINKVKNGYLIKGNINEMGWTLYTFISNQYLWEKSDFVFKFFLLSFFISITLILLSISKVLDRIIKPITNLSLIMSKNTYNNMDTIEIAYTGNEIQTLYECYQIMIKEIQKGIQEKIDNEKLKKDMELEIMLSQINPHYLYNILNTIVYLAADGKNKDVVKITNALMYSLQTTINLGEHDIETTIKDELELTKCYIDIQKYRYPDMFNIEINCPDNISNLYILKTSIQPLVENAIIHGVLNTNRHGEIIVSIDIIEDYIRIIVKDNGIGMKSEIIENFINNQEIKYKDEERKHIGISNIRDRIRYLYGAPYKMQINNLDCGMEIILILPIINK